jgi:hypothetical protein
MNAERFFVELNYNEFLKTLIITKTHTRNAWHFDPENEEMSFTKAELRIIIGSTTKVTVIKKAPQLSL